MYQGETHSGPLLGTTIRNNRVWGCLFRRGGGFCNDVICVVVGTTFAK